MSISYERKEILSNLHETSKNSKGVPLLDKSHEKYQVYNLDKVKDRFCEYYRHNEKLRSCDAYYYDDNKNYLVIEFKRAHHFKLLEYWDDIEIKLIDTRLLLKDTFMNSGKANAVQNQVKVVLVYDDDVNYEAGVKNISHNLNTMKPINGNTSRNSKEKSIFKDENSYQLKLKETIGKYKEVCYSDIKFVEKKEFIDTYINSHYFDKITEWDKMS